MPMPDFTQPAGMVPPATSAGAATPQSQGFDWDSLFKALGQFQAPSGHQFSPATSQMQFGGGLLPPPPVAPMQRPDMDLSGIQGLLDMTPKQGGSSFNEDGFGALPGLLDMVGRIKEIF